MRVLSILSSCQTPAVLLLCLLESRDDQGSPGDPEVSLPDSTSWDDSLETAYVLTPRALQAPTVVRARTSNNGSRPRKWRGGRRDRAAVH